MLELETEDHCFYPIDNHTLGTDPILQDERNDECIDDEADLFVSQEVGEIHLTKTMSQQGSLGCVNFSVVNNFHYSTFPLN